jgi:hypothetical protein
MRNSANNSNVKLQNTMTSEDPSAFLSLDTLIEDIEEHRASLLGQNSTIIDLDLLKT